MSLRRLRSGDAGSRNSVTDNCSIEARLNLPPVSAEYIIDLYDRYLRDPNSVDESWRPYFHELWGRSPTFGGSADSALDVAAARLVDAYRQRGHFAASVDPLGLWQPPRPHDLDLAAYGIDAGSMDCEIAVPSELNSTTP